MTKDPSTDSLSANWAALQADAEVGEEGEKSILASERRHLREIGRGDLASLVQSISHAPGPPQGYDILSYTDNGEERHIEVKTTKGGRDSPLFITHNELARAESDGEMYLL